jgi:16S rRNA (cytosine967-C5)-methyltransferase
MTLRVNKRRCSVDAYLDLLRSHDIGALHLGGEAVVLSHPMPVDKVPGFADGSVSVQDASAQYAAVLLDLAPGMRVLDACSAPGGKTGHLLEVADVQVVALDSDLERLKRVADNLVRLKLTAELKAADAAAVDTWWDGEPFDRILIDAPCTGSGVTRRHPDIKWMRRPTDIAQFTDQQNRLLETLWPTLRLGGKLLYATCSVFREENNEQITAYLSRHRDACSLPLTGLQTIDGQIVPDDFHDGFFYALLAKTGSV